MAVTDSSESSSLGNQTPAGVKRKSTGMVSNNIEIIYIINYNYTLYIGTWTDL